MATPRIGIRHDTTTNWSAENPTLLADETVLIDDELKLIRGDGNAYNTSYDEIGTLGATGMIAGGYLGDIIPRAGNIVAPSAAHPRFCMTGFTGSETLAAANWPLLVPWLRSQKIIYLEGLAGETSTFAGTAAGSVITLSDTTANNDMLAALVEFQADFGTYTNWLTIDWDGTTYAITDVDAATRQITVTGTPTAGAGNLTIYPHRIAGSTTTARVHSAVGKDLRGAGTVEYLAGLMWRDQMQGIEGEVSSLRGDENTVGAFSSDTAGANLGASVSSTVTASEARIRIDSGDSTSPGNYGQARAGTTTRGAGMGAHYYLHGGRYAA